MLALREEGETRPFKSIGVSHGWPCADACRLPPAVAVTSGMAAASTPRRQGNEGADSELVAQHETALRHR
jgi:hypothetical protein